MGGCKSKDETADSIRKTPYKRGQDTLIKPKPS